MAAGGRELPAEGRVPTFLLQTGRGGGRCECDIGVKGLDVGETIGGLRPLPSALRPPGEGARGHPRTGLSDLGLG